MKERKEGGVSIAEIVASWICEPLAYVLLTLRKRRSWGNRVNSRECIWSKTSASTNCGKKIRRCGIKSNRSEVRARARLTVGILVYTLLILATNTSNLSWERISYHVEYYSLSDTQIRNSKCMEARRASRTQTLHIFISFVVYIDYWVERELAILILTGISRYSLTLTIGTLKSMEIMTGRNGYYSYSIEDVKP